MGKADFLRLGDWNILCDRCGRKLKAGDAKMNWQGNWMCKEHWEPRQPQDFARAIVENPTPEFVRKPPDVFINVSDEFLMEEASDSFTPGEDTLDFLLMENGQTILTEN